ncbi:hypothetical protein KY284_035288 [Solanum tuberosum]|nr:hypothetical protein KY284_035288 [Solanum tuberosum]
MVDKVDLLFYYGGRWVLTPTVIYIKKLTHVWKEYDPDLLSYIDICEEFHEKLGFSKVQQLLLKGPSGKYYLIEGDSGIRTIQTALSVRSGVLELFAVDEGDDVVPAIDISHNNEPYLVTIDAATEGETSEEENDENEPYLVTLDAATEGESSEEENDENEPYPSDYNSEELESFRLEKKREVNDQLDNFKELEKGMSFKNLEEAKRIVSYYSIARKVALRVDKSDSVRVRYKCIVGCPFVCLISEVKKGQGFEIKTLQTKHTCPEAFKNRRATQQALAHYFKKRVQNDHKCKVNEMRKIVDDNFRLNISYSKMKRVKRLVLEKLDGGYVDDFNKLEGYAQELRDSNPGTDGLIGAVGDLLPKAQHRWCARHIEANWSRSWSGVQMKKMFWWSAWSTYEEEFNDQLKSMGSVSKQAAKDLLWYPPQHWCRAFFDTIYKNHSCENNFTESFNKWILEARAKPIIKMLEDIRIKVMKRLKQLEEEGKRWTEKYCPYSMDLYHDFRMIAQGCQVVANGDLGYELQKGRQVLPAPQPSEENESVFMPTPGFVASSSRQTSQQSSQASNEASGPSKSKRKNVSKDKVDAIPKRSKNSGKEIVIAPSIATVDEDEVEDGIESEDEDIVFAPRMISEEKTRLQMKKLQQQPCGSRRISFRGDENGASIPTNLPYSPKKLTWKGKACVTSNQLTKDKEKKIGKLKAKRGKH